jgi:hypothetical protein
LAMPHASKIKEKQINLRHLPNRKGKFSFN